MTTFALVLSAFLMVFALKQLIHIYRYKTDIFYKFQTNRESKRIEFEGGYKKRRMLFKH